MPIDHIPGMTMFYRNRVTADGSILGSPDLQRDANTLLPRLDGITVLLPEPPPDFTSNNPPTFRSWHTAHQLEYIFSSPDRTTLSVTDGGNTITTTTLSIPPGAASPSDQIHAIVRAGGFGVMILNDLSPGALKRLTLADQCFVAGHPEFAALLGEPYGLRPGPGDTGPADVRAEYVQLIDDLIAVIQGAPPLRAASATANPATLITEQLTAMKDRLGTMAIFDDDAITKGIVDLEARYRRLERYGTAPEAPTAGLISTDGNASIRQAYAIFVQSEERRVAIMRITDDAARTGLLTITGTDGGILRKQLDVPGLTYVFQRAENADGEAEGQAETEEIRQRNALMQNYAEMQRRVNAVSGSFPTPDGTATFVTDTRTIFHGASSEERAALTPIVRMFTTAFAGTHPAEAATSLPRPTLAFTGSSGDARFTKSQFDSFASALGDAASVLDRDVQILSDKANRISRERNQHFDLATQTLTRMADLVNLISRGIN